MTFSNHIMNLDCKQKNNYMSRLVNLNVKQKIQRIFLNIITSPPLKAAYIQILNVLNTNVEQIQMFSHAAVLLTNH